MAEARIYRRSKTAMQSGRAKTHHWVLEYAPGSPRRPDPLMGWASSADTLHQIELKFETREEAVAYAEKKGLDYVVQPEHVRRVVPRNYADNFRQRPR